MKCDKSFYNYDYDSIYLCIEENGQSYLYNLMTGKKFVNNYGDDIETIIPSKNNDIIIFKTSDGYVFTNEFGKVLFKSDILEYLAYDVFVVRIDGKANVYDASKNSYRVINDNHEESYQLDFYIHTEDGKKYLYKDDGIKVSEVDVLDVIDNSSYMIYYNNELESYKYIKVYKFVFSDGTYRFGISRFNYR